MDTTVNDIVEGLKTTALSVLGAGYSEMKYVEEPTQNTTRGNNDRYGVRHLGGVQLPGVTRYMTFSQTFEIILTKSYYQSSIGDSGARTAALELSGLMNDIYREVIRTRANAPGVVLHVDQLELSEPEYNETSKYTLLRGQLVVQWRINLD